MLSTVLTKHFSGYNLEQSRTEMSEANFTAWRQGCIEALPLTAIYGSGEFHLSRSFADVDCKCFQLAGPIVSRGSVREIVGDYVGGEAYTITALKKNKDRLPPPAACGLMSAHSSAPMTAGDNFNCLQGLTSTEVDVILAAEGILCTRDQAQFINVIGARLNAFHPEKAAPGSSKATLAEGIVRASIPKFKEHQKIIWHLKTRQQRDKQWKRLRNARGISVQVAVVDRAAYDNNDDEEDDVFLDAALQLEVDQRLLHFDQALRELKDQLSAYTGPPDVKTPEGQVWKLQSENTQHIAVARYAAKLHIWEYALKKINVFCMTVDCFFANSKRHFHVIQCICSLGHSSCNLRRGTSNRSSERIRCVPSRSDRLHVRRPTAVHRVVSLG
jgi:hypothetical protein